MKPLSCQIMSKEYAVFFLPQFPIRTLFRIHVNQVATKQSFSQQNWRKTVAYSNLASDVYAINTQFLGGLCGGVAICVLSTQQRRHQDPQPKKPKYPHLISRVL